MGGKKIPMNKHAAEAMNRKTAAKNAKDAAAAKAADDAYWADSGDKKANKKSNKKEAEAEKARAKAARAEEKRALEKEEEANMKSKKPDKVTKAMIDKEMAKNKPKPKAAPAGVVSVEQQNKLLNHTSNKIEKDVDASDLKSAVEQLERVNFATEESQDAHPERRRKQAHLAFEEKTIPQLKADNPGLKHSQLKEMCFKLWQKSPENPMVQEMMKRHKAMQQQQS
eukprot:TRINITY_DN16639_c2_g1_i2.p1 TRINITY_DN16639_c2_g1~~TRINITY_DN16639_c2_g1_i2.p1  ORF type:complete len:242 (+),score=84.27 TRINITY_DN16639_c2_g1_i2:52-726(+)